MNPNQRFPESVMEPSAFHLRVALMPILEP
jgi:hypothetical protein